MEKGSTGSLGAADQSHDRDLGYPPRSSGKTQTSTFLDSGSPVSKLRISKEPLSSCPASALTLYHLVSRPAMSSTSVTTSPAVISGTAPTSSSSR